MARTTPAPMQADLRVKLGGTDLTPAEIGAVLEARVVDNLRLPDSALIRFRDQDMKLADDSKYKAGAELEIRMSQRTSHPGAKPPTEPLFKGKIVALEPEWTPRGVQMIVRAYDPSYKLHLTRSTRVFKDVTYTDVVSKVARAAGLAVKPDSAPGVHKYVIQNDETDWQFLWRLADSIGFEVLMGFDGQTQKLLFRKAGGGASPDTAPELKWGEDLLSFRPRVTAAAQIKGTHVRAWDENTKKAITSDKDSGATASKPGIQRSAVYQDGFGSPSARVQVSDEPVRSQQEADALAQSAADKLANAFTEAEGVCNGNPDVHAGAKVKISGIGTRFGGDYVLGSTTHLFSKGGYHTQFTVSGRAARSMIDLVTPTPRREFANHLVVGIVTNNKDPDNLGRVKVKFPTLRDDDSTQDLESEWARLVFPQAAGPNRGFIWFPDINDEVVVGFEHGDPRRPYVIGCVYNGTTKPPDVGEEGGAKKTDLIVKSPQSANMDFKKKIDLKSGEEYTLQVGKDATIKVQQNAVTEAQQSVKVKASQNIEQKASASMKLEATSDLQAKAMNVTIQGNAAVNIKAPNITVQADAMLQLKGGAGVIIQGAIIKLN